MDGSTGALVATPPAWSTTPVPVVARAASRPPRHVHLVASLSLGGAERIVADLARAFAECGTEADIVALHDAAQEHRFPEAPGLAIHRLGSMPRAARMGMAAGLVRASRLPAYCHVLSGDEMRELWALGCSTVPVAHNAAQGWLDDPATWDASPHVPFVAACGEAVARDLAAAGLRKPVRVLRHLVPKSPAMDLGRRAHVRHALGCGPGTLLIGMVGRVVPQKRYDRAVGVLAALLGRGIDARLAILGATKGPTGRAAREALETEATRLGVRASMVLPGPVGDASALVAAFDVFLNTSDFEGVSIATMEAVAAGIPVVSADVGGQAEAIGSGDEVIPPGASASQWAEAVLRGTARHGQGAAPPAWLRQAVAHSWPWTLALGPGASLRPVRGRVLFVTSNLDVGGAQRSLCNLAAEMPCRGIEATVAVCGEFGVPGFMADAEARGVSFLDISGGGGLDGRAGRVMALVHDVAPEALAFWNLDPETKTAVVKAMAGGPVRICDVSPGPMLYRSLDRAAARAGRGFAMDADQFVASLDLLVSKYRGGGPSPGRALPKHVAIIPNGVPEPGLALPPGVGPTPPPGANPLLAVVTVGRLVPEKRPDLLPRVARALDRLLPGATLTVVGGVHEEAGDEGWRMALDACGDAGFPPNLAFAGPDHRAIGFLPRFALFYMVSADQGCPNASLEAMASGLPVVANPDGGTAEQVEDGVTGRLVGNLADPDAQAETLALAMVDVLRDPARARAMGEAGRARARDRFSMASMADAYIRALLAR